MSASVNGRNRNRGVSMIITLRPSRLADGIFVRDLRMGFAAARVFAASGLDLSPRRADIATLPAPDAAGSASKRCRIDRVRIRHSMNVEECLAAGYELRRARQLDAALERFERAAEIGRAAAEPVALAHAMIGVGQIERDLGRTDQAERAYVDAVALIRPLGDALWLAHTVRHVGDIRTELGRPDEALASFVESITIYRREPAAPPLDLANALRGYAIVKEQLDDNAEASALWREARAIYATLGIDAGVAECDKRLTGFGSPAG